MTINKKQNMLPCIYIVGIYFLGFAIRYVGLPKISGDMYIYLLEWFKVIKEMGLKECLSTQVGNYGTLYQLLIFILTRLPGEPVVLIKLPSILFDVVLAIAVYFWTRELTDDKWAKYIAMGVTFLLPTVWLNSAMWGQCDSMYVSVILWGIYLLYKEKTIRGYLLLGIAFALKLQTVFIFPFVGYLILHRLHMTHEIKSIKAVIKEALMLIIIPLTWIGTGIPNFIAGKSLHDFFATYLEQADTYHEMSKNYPSFWNLFRLNYESFHRWAILITFCILFLFLTFLIKIRKQITKEDFIWCAFLFSYTCVIFLPAMHERYGFLYEILAVILIISKKRGYLLLVLLQSISFATYMIFLEKLNYNYRLLAIMNISVYLGCFIVFVGKFVRNKYIDLVCEKYRNIFCKKEGVPYQGILWITFLFLLIGCYRIGNVDAPSTGLSFMESDTDQHEIYLRFDRTTSFQSIMIFNGEKHDGSIHAYAAEGREWTKIVDEGKIERVFKWNKIPFEATTWNIDLIINDAYIREIVLLDTDGNRIYPINASDYPELFDEQNYYPRVVSYYDGTMFDEIYHARTAYEFLHKKTVYENTHPPLGKILISIGIAIYGMNPFGWRIMSLLFGTMIIPILCLFAYEITKDRRITVLSGVLIATEFMHFTLSRIGTIDIFVAFFVVCMFYGMYLFCLKNSRKGLCLAGISSAFGIATKWTALYAMAGIGILWLIWFIHELIKNRKQPMKVIVKEYLPIIVQCIFLFVLLPAAVYVLSYLPFVNANPEKGLIAHAIDNSKHMLAYHNSVNKSHPYMSSWYSWLVDWVPLLDSYDHWRDKISTVATFINPATCFLGLLCVFHQAYLFLKKKDKNAGFLIIFYMIMLVPWMLITRTVFIYQYFICTLALNLIICNSIASFSERIKSKIIWLVGGLSVLFFLCYYPVISGFPVSGKYIEILQILPKWIL